MNVLKENDQGSRCHRRRSGAGAYGTRRRIVGIRGEGDVKGPRPGSDLREAPAQ